MPLTAAGWSWISVPLDQGGDRALAQLLVQQQGVCQFSYAAGRGKCSCCLLLLGALCWT